MRQPGGYMEGIAKTAGTADFCFSAETGPNQLFLHFPIAREQDPDRLLHFRKPLFGRGGSKPPTCD